MLRCQKHTNTFQFSNKIGWNVELITVDETELRRDYVSNKEIANEKIEKRIGEREARKFSCSQQMCCLESVSCLFLDRSTLI